MDNAIVNIVLMLSFLSFEDRGSRLVTSSVHYVCHVCIAEAS